jgi:phosphoenolpyruvate phosphomutase
VLDVTTKPILFDANTGGHPEHLAATVRSLGALGVGLMVEDKIGLKHNSLLGSNCRQAQEPVRASCSRFAPPRGRLSADFLVFARIETLILGGGIEDALLRAHMSMLERMAS